MSTMGSRTWTTPDADPRSHANPVGELATYRQYLTNYRLTLRMKCEGLGADELAARSVPPSALSLLGLVRHLAEVERFWFQEVILGRTDLPDLYSRQDDRDGDFDGAAPDPEVVREAFATWDAEIATADQWLDTLDEAELGREVRHPRDGIVAIRDIVVHLIEEYARHAGHADLLREAIDGRTGQ
jgi:uncharacterized damage-inducible protein DinB